MWIVLETPQHRSLVISRVSSRSSFRTLITAQHLLVNGDAERCFGFPLRSYKGLGRVQAQKPLHASFWRLSTNKSPQSKEENLSLPVETGNTMIPLPENRQWLETPPVSVGTKFISLSGFSESMQWLRSSLEHSAAIGFSVELLIDFSVRFRQTQWPFRTELSCYP